MERQNFSQYHIKASTSVPFKIFRTREPKNASPPPAPQDPQGPIINGDEDEFEIGWDLGPFAAVLKGLHLDKYLFEQQNTRKL